MTLMLDNLTFIYLFICLFVYSFYSADITRRGSRVERESS
jgi:hypothetical protein